MGIVNRQVEAYPGFALALETLDVARAQGGCLGSGIQFGRHLQAEVEQHCVFIQAVYGFLCGGETQARQ
ncbi:hypothetical protein D3C80_1550630 [compost metagenome]